MSSGGEIDDSFSVDADADFVGSKSPTKLNGRKIEIIHKKIMSNNLGNSNVRKAETFSDEDGWTTDF